MDISYCSLGLLGTAVFASYLDPEVWNMNLVKKKKYEGLVEEQTLKHIWS